MLEETPDNYSRENQHSQIETENPTNVVPPPTPALSEQGLEVEGQLCQPVIIVKIKHEEFIILHISICLHSLLKKKTILQSVIFLIPKTDKFRSLSWHALGFWFDMKEMSLVARTVEHRLALFPWGALSVTYSWVAHIL